MAGAAFSRHRDVGVHDHAAGRERVESGREDRPLPGQRRHMVQGRRSDRRIAWRQRALEPRRPCRESGEARASLFKHLGIDQLHAAVRTTRQRRGGQRFRAGPGSTTLAGFATATASAAWMSISWWSGTKVRMPWSQAAASSRR